MTSRREVLTGAAAAALGWNVCVPASGAEAPLSDAASDAPMTITADGAVVPIILHGRQTQGTLDTGASHTVVDAAFAREVGLLAQEPVAVGGAFGSLSGAMSHQTHLQIGGRGVAISPIVVDLSASGLGVPVIVGADFFRAGPVRFDFGANLFRMLEPTPAGGRIDGYEVPLGRSSRAILQLSAQVDGNPVLLGLDTGSQTALILPAIAGGDRPESTWVTADITGWRVHAVRSASVTIGGTELSRVPASVIDAATEGLIGLPALSRFNITLDMAHERIWFAPLPSVSQPFPRDRLGLAMIPGEQGLAVVHVAANSPAWKAGFVIEDQIVKVDDEAVTDETASRLRRTGRGPVGAVVKLETASGAVRFVELAEYF
ncbi:retroviral-like aspartic protease family protein [Brevundimonas naejangsanensis]|uniref:retroviral-like aspartic protease family protein n=1 Tax=Brevundimonas naejangsanensis TaxID=588932 RepID=UPI0026F0D381|nr:retroviral-like aspartic protease family protein [Brevundimonas naejangsanensis]